MVFVVNWCISSFIRKYELHSDRELCYSNLKLISDKKDILKFLMHLISCPMSRFLEWLMEVKLWSPQSLSQNNALATQTYNLNSDTICRIVSYITLKFFMTFDIMFCRLVFRVVLGSEIIIPNTSQARRRGL